uniref:C2H2-type domain-containing protein n=1 Tax=Knipowitschia caucasica TaxID=637954 RepID=A0AAV2JDH7_KNICA
MSRSETVRAFVNERLAVVAEEIFTLFEWIIAEYEEKLSRSQEEHQRSNQEPVDSTLHSPGVQISAVRSETQNADYSLVKDEPQELQVKQQEDAFTAHSLLNCFVLIERLAASSVTCEKIVDLLQPKPNEHKVETQGEEMNADPYSQTGADMDSSDNDNNEDWGAPYEQDEDLDNQVYSRDRTTRTFLRAWELIRHRKTHSTKEEHGHRPTLIPNPKSSVSCVKTKESSYTEKDNRGIPGEQLQIEEDKDLHKRDTNIPKRRKPYCPICNRHFKSSHQKNMHFLERHSDVRSFSCPICGKCFARRATQMNHARTHREGRPDRRPKYPVIPKPESSVVLVEN